MKQKLLSIATLATVFFCSLSTALAQTTPQLNPERIRDQKASYDAKENTVTITATAPSRTEYDWDTYYTDFPLDHISYISIKRHTPGTSWPTEELGRVENPELGKTFSYIDKDVAADKQYEYSFTVVVDKLQSQESYLQVYTGLTPSAVRNFKATTKNATTNTIDFTVTAPDTAITGESLQGQKLSIRLEQQTGFLEYTDIDTIENVQPGQTISFSKSGFELKQNYRFRVQAYVGNEGKGSFEQTDIYVGLDYPGTPLNLKTEPVGNGVHLTWDAPEKGSRGGSYDPDITTYTLTRVYTDGTKETAASGIKGTDYTDTPQLTEERALSYELEGVNLAGSSLTAAKSDTVVIGPASKLPFKESFSGAALTYKGWSTKTTQDDSYYIYKAWNFLSSGSLYYFPTDEYMTIEPQDSDGGMAICTVYGYAKEGQTESLISPHIDVMDKKSVTLSFGFYFIPKAGSDNELKVYVSKDDGAWENVFNSSSIIGLKPKWRTVNIAVALNSNSKIRLKFDAIAHNSSTSDIFIDNIKVEDAVSTGISSIRKASTLTKDAPRYNLSGQRVSDSYKGIVIQNGHKYVAR